MNKLITILLVAVLTSCGCSLEPPMSNTDHKNIIGKPFKIGNLEIAQYDFPKEMRLEDAPLACEALGEGWRLPTRDECNILYKNRYKIGGFEKFAYWSSTEIDGDFAWDQTFYDSSQFIGVRENAVYVRAVRAF